VDDTVGGVLKNIFFQKYTKRGFFHPIGVEDEAVTDPRPENEESDSLPAFEVRVLEAPEETELGTFYTFDSPKYGADYTVEVSAVRVVLGEDYRVAVSGPGEALVYRRFDPYGKRLTDAINAGWCRVLEGKRSQRSPAGQAGGGGAEEGMPVMGAL